jgi:hypothetical protein
MTRCRAKYEGYPALAIMFSLHKWRTTTRPNHQIECFVHVALSLVPLYIAYRGLHPKCLKHLGKTPLVNLNAQVNKVKDLSVQTTMDQ